MEKIGKVNERGLAHLKAWIESTAASDEAGPLQKTDARALDAWACEAEEAMGNGNPPMVEMSANVTKSGCPETFTIPDDGVRWEDEDSEDAAAPNILIQFNAEQASAPIRWKMADPDSDGGPDEWQSTPYQTADAGHCRIEAEKMVQAWLSQQ